MSECERVLVTGASRGIGRAISHLYEESGFEVISPSRKEMDLLSRDSVLDFIDSNGNEPFDVIINNAGLNETGLLTETCPEAIDRMVSVNLVGPMLLLRGLSEPMIKKGYGRIVNISSVLSVMSRRGRSVYSATKCGIHGLTMALSLELAPYGILVNTVSPGFTMTDMTAKNNTAEEIAAICKDIPLGRMAQSEEIAAIVKFLGSRKNTYITGQNIVIDGGYSIG